MEHYYPLIMAGGGGTRLWPLSRKNTPKQLLPLIDEHSMFRTCVLRLLPMFAPEQIYIVTGRDYVNTLQAETPEIPRENFIAEPYGKNTGPAVGLAMTTIQQRDPQATVAILTADHHIGKADDFRRVLQAAHEFAQHDHIVTLGISPTFPSTGFGYIHQGEALFEVHGFTGYQSLGFKEKPDLETATQFLASGDYSWNSGMFIWKAERALAEFKRQQPEMYAKLMALAPHVDTAQYESHLTEIWESLPAKSLDYAIMEGAENVTVIPADIGWSDVGAWDALFDILELDSAGNGHKGSGPERIILDNQNTIVYSDRLAVTIGVDDLIVVDTDDVLFICHKDRAQDVRTVVDQLRAADNERYL